MHKYVFWLLLVALILLRYVGVTHGAPLVYHTDEPALVRSACGIFFDPLIDHFDWPHFYFYITYGVFAVFAKLRGLLEVNWPAAKELLPLIWDQNIVFYVVARFVTITFSVMTAVPIYYIVKKLINSKSARFATLAFLLIPGLNYQAHYALPDTPLMFFITVGVALLLFAFTTHKRFSLILYILSSAIFGLATGGKYNGLLFFVLVPIFYLYHHRRIFAVGIKNRKHIFLRTFLHLLFFGLVFLLSFVITTPSLLVYFDRFWSYEGGVGVLWQYQQNLSSVTFAQYPYALYLCLFEFIANTSIFAIALFVVMPGILIVEYRKSNISSKRNSYIVILWLFSTLYILNTARYNLAGFRFLVPIIPLIFIVCIYSLYKIVLLFKVNTRVLICLLIIFFISIGYQTIMISYKFSNPTTMNLAHHKMLETYYDQKIYIKGEELDRINRENTLGLARLKQETLLQSGDVVFILVNRDDYMQNYNVKYTLVEKIDCGGSCIGPAINVYRID